MRDHDPHSRNASPRRSRPAPTRRALVGLVPAAGRARRLQPLNGSKELIPIGGRPVMDYVVERLRRAGCDEIRVVTRPDKPDVRAHARALGATVIEAEPPTLAASLARGVEGLDAETLVAIGLPDTIWQPVDGYRRLLDALRDVDADGVLGLFTSRQPQNGDVVSLDATGRVGAVDVKPSEPASDLVWGCAVVRRSALSALGTVQEPGELLDRLARGERLYGVRLSDDFIDIGTETGLRIALAEVARL